MANAFHFVLSASIICWVGFLTIFNQEVSGFIRYPFGLATLILQLFFMGWMGNKLIYSVRGEAGSGSGERCRRKHKTPSMRIHFETMCLFFILTELRFGWRDLQQQVVQKRKRDRKIFSIRYTDMPAFPNNKALQIFRRFVHNLHQRKFTLYPSSLVALHNVFIDILIINENWNIWKSQTEQHWTDRHWVSLGSS